MIAKTYTIKYDAYTEHVQGLTTRSGKNVCGALERSGSYRTGKTYGNARAAKNALGHTSRGLCQVCATALEFAIKWELEDERVAAGTPASGYDRPHSVQFSQTQMKISYTDDDGTARRSSSPSTAPGRRACSRSSAPSRTPAGGSGSSG